MGVRFQRTSIVAPGKGDEAREFAAAISAYVTETFGTELIWGVEIGKTFGKIYWYVDYPNMTELETAFQLTMTDEGYRKLVDDASDLFLAGQTEDTIVYTM